MDHPLGNPSPHWIKGWLKENGISQSEAAFGLKLHLPTFNRILKGWEPCPLELEQKLQAIRTLIEELKASGKWQNSRPEIKA